MSANPHHPPRARRHAFKALTSEAAALEVITMTAATSPDASVIALVEDRAARCGIAIPVEGDDPGGEGIQRLDATLVEALGGQPGCRLVLASMRPHVSDTVPEDDLEHWRRLRARHEGSGLELVDWLVVAGDGTSVSLGEIAGPPPVWG